MWYIYRQIDINRDTHTHNGILLNYKKEWNFVTCSNMDGLGKHYAKWNKSNKWDRNKTDKD